MTPRVWVDKHWTKSRWFTLRWLIAWVENVNVKRAHLIVVVSRPLKDDLILRGIPAHKILVNPNGVDADLYDPEKLKNERAEIRKKLAIEDKFVFGFIGSFSVWHGINVLGHMIPELIKNNHTLHFLLIGDGPLLADLKRDLEEADIKNGVTFLGMVPNDKARTHLAACDAFLSPTQPNPDGSHFFGSPTKMFEYMSMSKPIIASDLGQLQELLRPAFKVEDAFSEDRIGFLVNPKNTQDFIIAAQRVADMNPHHCAVVGNNARMKVIREYTWDKHVSRIVGALAHNTHGDNNVTAVS